MYHIKMAERSTQVELLPIGRPVDDRNMLVKHFDGIIEGQTRVEGVEIQAMLNGVGVNGENKENEECSKQANPKPPNTAGGPTRMVWVPVVPPNQGQPKIGVNRDISSLTHQQQTALAHVQANLQRSVTHANKTAHMVQNQMPPSYQYAQPGLEEYHHQVVSTASTAPPDGAQFKDQPAFSPPTAAAVTANGGVEQQTQTDLEGESQSTGATNSAPTSPSNTGPKRLHVSNIPFRFREADLRQLLAFGPILDVEIIFNERGSKGFGFVTFANSADADRAREKLNGTVVEGRKIEVNNATARVMTKKTPAPTIPNAAALRGVALTRGRAAAARGAYTAAAAAAAAAFRHPSPLATAATALPYAAGVYQDPFLAAAAYPERYQVGNVLVTSQPYAAGYPATAARYAIPAVASAATYAAAAGYGREYAADPYLGHSIGPVPGFGATVYGRAGYQRYTPY